MADPVARRFLEFFAANIRNPHTCRAYGHDVAECLIWRDVQGVSSIETVHPLCTRFTWRPGSRS